MISPHGLLEKRCDFRRTWGVRVDDERAMVTTSERISQGGIQHWKEADETDGQS